MSGDEDISCSLISAVREGRLQTVQEMISSHGLSYSETWLQGYSLLCDALEKKHTDISELLLTNGSKVNINSMKPTNTPLHFAVMNGDIEIVEMLLDRGADANVENQFGWTPLHNAVKSKNMEIIVLLISRGANVDATSENSNISTFQKAYTPLCLAVERGYKEIVELFINRGANVDAKGKDGETALHIAAKKGYLHIVEHLLKHGANVHSAYTSTFQKNYTPLCLAVERGNKEIVELFISRGANVDVKGEDGVTPLHIAAKKGYLHIVEHLLKHDAYVNSPYTSTKREGYTPLCLAVARGSKNIVELLTNKGANVDAKGKDGVTSLHIAVERGYLQIAEHLLKHGANVNSAYTSTKWEGYTLLCLAAKRRHEKIVKLLFEYGAYVDAQDKEGNTVLHFAVEGGNPVIVKYILKHCPDVNNKSNRNTLIAAVYGYGEKYSKIVANLIQYGFTVNPEDVTNSKLLHDAPKKGYLKIVEELLKYGTDVNTLSCMLYVATENQQQEMAKLLISHGADVTGQDETGIPPLFSAVEYECKEIVKVILEHGADVNASDEYGRTALHFTALRRRRCTDFDDDIFEYWPYNNDNLKAKIAKLLLNRGANVNAQIHGLTTLHAAVDGGNEKVVEVLLEYNADVNSITAGNHITPLHVSASRGDELITKMLLKHGADINITSTDNQTPLDVATDNKVRQILMDHIIKIKVANLYLTEKNLLSIIDNNYFQDECEKEIANMRSEKIANSNISFYDVLTKSIYQVEIILENENILQILKSDNYKITFPIYASMINIQFRKGKLLIEANKYFYNIFPHLPYYCTKYIFSYLSDADLQTLISACQPANVVDEEIISSISKRPRLA